MNSKAKKARLDEIVYNRGLAESRSQAKALIMGGKIRSGTVVLDKPGKEVPETIELELETPPPYVSRGGEKLAGFLALFPVPISGKTVLDVGASTGGFTDCLLQKGAISSTCIDVGHGQLHFKLQQDERVTNIEKYNARNAQSKDLPLPHYDIIVMDLSFISITKVLPNIWPLLAPDGVFVALVKPQFEAQKKEVDAGKGVISDNRIRERILEEITTFTASMFPDAHQFGCCESPISGAKGNLEYLVGWKRLA